MRKTIQHKNNIRSAYQMKRHRDSYKKRKANRKRYRRTIWMNEQKKIKILSNPFEKIKAPEHFSLIENTNQVVKYINDCKEYIKQGKNVEWDISDVNIFTPDAITLFAACFNDPNYKKCLMRGNHPKNDEVRKIFVESGFHDFVCCDERLKCHSNHKSNYLHKESDYKVQGAVARDACKYGVAHVFGNYKDVQELYEMLVEAMSNTNNHAAGKDKEGEIKWWLYTCNSNNELTSYSFVDLGVGIFDSAPFNLFKRISTRLGFKCNADYVPKLLSGEIGSRKEYEHNVRGKGIPQIARNSKKDYIKRAYIISNDVKIDLKTGDAIPLNEEFKGTFLYWELFDPSKQNEYDKDSY